MPTDQRPAAPSEELASSLQWARSYLQSRERAAAEERYRRALALAPDSPEALHGVAAICMEGRRFGEAVSLIGRLVAAQPDDALYVCMLGAAYEGLCDLERAVECYRRSLALDQSRPDTVRALTAALLKRGEYQEAVGWARQIPDSDKAEPGPQHEEAVGLQMLDRHNEAICVLNAALLARPGNVGLLERLAVSLSALGRHSEAASALERALTLQPQNARIAHDLAETLTELGRPDEARALFERAVELAPDNTSFHQALWNTALQAGDFRNGWPAYERWANMAGNNREFPKPRWEGEAQPDGGLLVYADGGFGDALLMLRFLPAVRERFRGRLVVEARPQMVGLVRNDPAVDLVVEQHPDRTPPDISYDAVIGLMSLPGLLGVTLEDLPLRAPSARAAPDAIERWKARLAGYDGLRVGMCWAGAPGNERNARRSIPLLEFAPVARIPGVRLFSLQKGFGADHAAALADEVPLVDLGPELTDFAETAAAICNLDLVISVDTAVAHLAGSLGAAVWTLLEKHPCWMWLTEREDSPWYPSMRLFRKSLTGDWKPAIRRVAEELGRFGYD